MSNYAEICVDVFGDFAMFTRPDSKVERVTYLVPTPSACRGVLNAIYSKPIEFYYEITGIDVINPIKLISMKRNEITDKVNTSDAIKSFDYNINSSKCRTQRMCTYLKDVYYRIHARIVVRDDAPPNVNLASLLSQFNRRVESGKCFYQPCLGTRECLCYFSKPDLSKQPIDENRKLGVVLYDVFDITNNVPLDTKNKKKSCKVSPSFFDAVMKHGKIQIPLFNSGEILRAEV